MTQFKKQLTGAFATGLLLANLFTPALALATDPTTSSGGTTIIVTGNGEQTSNNVDVTKTNTTTVAQSNTAKVENNVNATADSGGNTAKGVTGGNVSIDTGNATTDVKVENVLNKNVADVKCCDKGETQVLIAGNGEQSKNDVSLDSSSTNSIFQDNNASVENKVDNNANTGKNKVESTTGGDVEITTGDATAKSDIKTVANTNLANIGGRSGRGGSSVKLIETGNGEDSSNKIDLSLTKDNTISQDNNAWVNNDVYSGATTGDNKAKSITGGSVSIDTGNAWAKAKVSNWLNFNSASVDCDCVGDIFAKENGNGEKSANDIKADLTSDTLIFQGEGKGNDAWIGNDVNASGKSGKNKVESTVGNFLHGDPIEVMTGDSSSTVDVQNKANENIVGPLPVVWPDLGVDFDFSLSWFQLWMSQHSA